MTNTLVRKLNTATFLWPRFLHTEIVSQAKLSSAKSIAGKILQILNLVCDRKIVQLRGRLKKRFSSATVAFV